MTEFSLTPDGKNRLFRLNMQILADVFTEHYQNVTFYAQNDRPCLEGIRLYKKGKNPNFRYVYLIQGRMWISLFWNTGTLILSLWDAQTLPAFIKAVLSLN